MKIGMRVIIGLAALLFLFVLPACDSGGNGGGGTAANGDATAQMAGAWRLTATDRDPVQASHILDVITFTQNGQVTSWVPVGGGSMGIPTGNLALSGSGALSGTFVWVFQDGGGNTRRLTYRFEMQKKAEGAFTGRLYTHVIIKDGGGGTVADVSGTHYAWLDKM